MECTLLHPKCGNVALDNLWDRKLGHFTENTREIANHSFENHTLWFYSDKRANRSYYLVEILLLPSFHMLELWIGNGAHLGLA